VLPEKPSCHEFNARFGGKTPQKKNASRILFLRYSDDPWQPAQVDGKLWIGKQSDQMPIIFTDDPKGSCAHCGAGCTGADIARLNMEKVKHLKKWYNSARVCCVTSGL